MKNSKAITRMQVILIIAVLIIAGIVGGVGYYLYFQPAGAEYIVIGFDLPLSGKNAYFGETQKIAYEMAIEDINEKGGVSVGGRKFNLTRVFYNDESDPTKVNTNVERLITVDNVDFILGPWTTPLGLPAGIVVETYRHLMITVGTGTLKWEEEKYNHTFIVYHSSIDESGVVFGLLEALPAETRPKKLAIWQEDSEVGRTYAQWAEKHATETYASSNYTIVHKETYTPGAVDYSSMILKTRDAGAEVVFTISSTADAVLFVRQSEELGFSPKLFHLLRGSEPKEFWDLLGKDAEASLATMTGFPYLPTPETLAVTAEYKQEHGGSEPSPYLTVSYAAVEVLVAAIEKAGTINRDKVREALSTLEVETVAGNVKFSGPGHADVTALAIQWQNGVQQVVYPPELKTGGFEYPKPPWS